MHDLLVVGEQELAAIRNLVRFTGDRPGLGTRAGCAFQLGTLGVYGLAMMSCGTVRDLVELAWRQGSGKFSWGMLDVRLQERGGVLQAVFDEASVPSDVRAFIIERDLAFSSAVLDLLVSPRQGITTTTTLAAGRVGELREAVGVHRLVPSGSRNMITFSASMLDEPLPYGDAHAAAMCESQCEQLLAGAAHRAPIGTMRAKVESALDHLPATAWSLEAVAAARFVHARTLHRLLAAEGASFRVIVDGKREQLATALLMDSELTVGQVAARVGYTDTHSFARAYKRWTGQTPGTVQRQRPTTAT